ncbi:MAG: hypothetical protein LBJ59_07410 [Zoogloeaceae bacterium]|jgi:hypothetical protein|nr:hypothetical protein [Zoogloeaceae bacterium]
MQLENVSNSSWSFRRCIAFLAASSDERNPAGMRVSKMSDYSQNGRVEQSGAGGF